MSRLQHVLQVGVHFKRPREGEEQTPRKTYKWGDYYELDAPPLVEDWAYREDVADFPNPYMNLDADGPKRRKEERDEWVREKRARRAQMATPPKTIEWHGYELDEPPLEEDDEYMRDIEGYGPWYASMDADGQKRAKEGRDAYVRKVRARRAEMVANGEAFEWRGYELNAPPLEEDAAYMEDVKDCPVKYMCLDSEGPKRFKETRDQWVRDKRARRADEAVPAYPDDAEQPRPPSPFSNDAELPSIYWRDPYPEEPEPPRLNHLAAAAPVEPEPPRYNTWSWGYDDEPEPPRWNNLAAAARDEETWPGPPDLPRYRPVYPSPPPRYKGIGAYEEDF